MSDRIEIFGSELLMRGEVEPGVKAPIITRPLSDIVENNADGSSGVLPPNVVFYKRLGKTVWMTYYIPPGVRALVSSGKIRRVAMPHIYLTIEICTCYYEQKEQWSFAGAYVHFADKEIITIDDPFLVDAPLPNTYEGGNMCLGNFKSVGTVREVMDEAIKAFWGNAYQVSSFYNHFDWFKDGNETVQQKWADPTVPTITLRAVLNKKRELSLPIPKSLRSSLDVFFAKHQDQRAFTALSMASMVHSLAAEAKKAKRITWKF